MSELISVDKINESKLYIDCCKSTFRQMYDFFTFYAKDYKHMPLYKKGIWDGKIKLIDWKEKTIPSGLIYNIIDWANKNDYELDLDPDIHLVDDDTQYFDSNNIFNSFNLPFEPYDYQHHAVNQVLTHHRRFLLSPTSSGKSLMIYAIIREILRCSDEKILIVCPTVNLVNQMYGDFEDYSSSNDFITKDYCHKIYSGQAKKTNKNVIISTWQSLNNMPSEYFEKFSAVIVDEAHEADGKSLTKIVQNCINAKYRVGLSGTLHGAKVHEYTLIGLFGSVYETVKTKEMIDRDITSKLEIKPIIFNFNDIELKKRVSTLKYVDEIEEIINNHDVNSFICKLALSNKNNTLILYRFVEKHGLVLFNLCKSLNKNKQVFFVAGSGKYKTPIDERDRIKKLAEENNDVIIIASYKTFSTGISIKNLHNIILAHPLKGRITLLQSIGRVLRKSKVGNLATVYDIVFDFTYRTKITTTFNHFKNRLKEYKKAGFKVIMKRVKVK